MEILNSLWTAEKTAIITSLFSQFNLFLRRCSGHPNLDLEGI